MLVEVTAGELLWERLKRQYHPFNGQQWLWPDQFHIALIEGLRELQWEETIYGNAQSGTFNVTSRVKNPKKKANIAGDYQCFFDSATADLREQGIDPQQVFQNVPDLEGIIQQNVHPPRLLSRLTRYVPTVGAIVGMVVGALGGGHLVDYFFDNETVAYLGSGFGTISGAAVGGYLTHLARLPLERYVSVIREQQTQNAYAIFLQRMEEWMSQYQPTQ